MSRFRRELEELELWLHLLWGPQTEERWGSLEWVEHGRTERQ